MKIQNISISQKEKLVLVSNFATLLTAGISILEAVDSLLEDSKGNQKKILTSLRENLIQGQHVYASFAQFPKVFDKVALNILKASEEAGTLDIALKDLKSNIRKEMEFGDNVKSALMYPLIIACVFVGVLIMILVVVMPKISVVFTRLKMDLPLPTRILIWISNFIMDYTIFLLLGLGAVIFTLIFLFITKRQAVVGMLYTLPGINTLVKQIDLAKFSRSLHLLLTSGIPITTALELSHEVVSLKSIEAILVRAKEMVMEGKRFSEGLKEAKGMIPYIMIKIVEAGEKTGSLDKSMQEISEFLDYEVTGSLKTLTALIEPVMLVLVGIMVGGMMLSIIAPIYGLIGQVSPQ